MIVENRPTLAKAIRSEQLDIFSCHTFTQKHKKERNNNP